MMNPKLSDAMFALKDIVSGTHPGEYAYRSAEYALRCLEEAKELDPLTEIVRIMETLETIDPRFLNRKEMQEIKGEYFDAIRHILYRGDRGIAYIAEHIQKSELKEKLVCPFLLNNSGDYYDD